MKKNVYEIITEKIIDELKKGNIPWRKPWKTGAPVNLVSKKEYRGINILILSMTPFSSPYFATINQINGLGGKVKKGAKGIPIVFFKFPKRETGSDENPDESEKNDSEKRRAPVLRYYKVFNLEQCEGLEMPVPEDEVATFNPIQECEKVVAGFIEKPPIAHGGQRACYRPSTDEIFMPPAERFDSAEYYYGTLYHELVHSSGHQKRLARKEVMDFTFFGDHAYSREELVAEIGASFLCGKTGIDISKIFKNQVAYIGSWLKELENDRRKIVFAAAQAQKATDFILGKISEDESNSEEKAIAA